MDMLAYNISIRDYSIIFKFALVVYYNYDIVVKVNKLLRNSH